MPSGDAQSPIERRFPLLDDPEPPANGRRRWIVVALAVATVAAGVVVALVTHGPSSASDRAGPAERSATAPARLPDGATPLPGLTGAQAVSFGVLGPAPAAADHISRRQALQRYDRIPGAASRSDRRVLTALVRAAYVDRGTVRRATFWIVSVWFHPPNIGVAPQHQWCVDHGLVAAVTGAAEGHLPGCLPAGARPKPVLIPSQRGPAS